MRIVKDADERKKEILDIADKLFTEKGFDGTSVTDILEKVGIAKGTLYYHFKSKEDIMIALVERTTGNLLINAKKIASNKTIPVLERLLQTLFSMQAPRDSTITKHIHNPQNALMNQKMEILLLKGITPILTEIVEDGIKENIFRTPFPYESVEMIVAHANAVFDYNYMIDLSEEEQSIRIKAFIFNMERIFSAKEGSLDLIMQLFYGAGEAND